MTLEKAIENRTSYLKNSKIPKSTDDYNATLLGIEALKAWQKHQRGWVGSYKPKLPGETED